MPPKSALKTGGPTPVKRVHMDNESNEPNAIPKGRMPATKHSKILGNSSVDDKRSDLIIGPGDEARAAKVSAPAPKREFKFRFNPKTNKWDEEHDDADDDEEDDESEDEPQPPAPPKPIFPKKPVATVSTVTTSTSTVSTVTTSTSTVSTVTTSTPTLSTLTVSTPTLSTLTVSTPTVSTPITSTLTFTSTLNSSSTLKVSSTLIYTSTITGTSIIAGPLSDCTLMDFCEPGATGPTGPNRVPVKLAGRDYYIDYDGPAQCRRKAVFCGDATVALTDQEDNLLKSIGIEGETRQNLAPYLYDFFEAVPNCQTTTQMLTSARCEVAYYVMWSVLLKARQDVKRKIDEGHKNGMSDPETHQTAARIDAIGAKILEGPVAPQAPVAIPVTAMTGATGPCEPAGCHNEHKEIEDMITRLEAKLNSVKEGIDSMKGSAPGSTGPVEEKEEEEEEAGPTEPTGPTEEEEEEEPAGPTGPKGPTLSPENSAKKKKYAIFKGYTPKKYRGITHFKTAEEKRLNKIWQKLDSYDMPMITTKFSAYTDLKGREAKLEDRIAGKTKQSGVQKITDEKELEVVKKLIQDIESRPVE